MIEIQNDYNVLKMTDKKVKIAFIAEAPGDLLKARYKIRNKNNEDKYYTISLIDNKSFKYTNLV